MIRRPEAPLVIDCATCPVQHVGCADCMVLVLTDPTRFEEPDVGKDLSLDPQEREVVSRLVSAGLVTAETATRARARREPWSEYREVAG